MFDIPCCCRASMRLTGSGCRGLRAVSNKPAQNRSAGYTPILVEAWLPAQGWKPLLGGAAKLSSMSHGWLAHAVLARGDRYHGKSTQIHANLKADTDERNYPTSPFTRPSFH